jgi:hypothetical protein
MGTNSKLIPIYDQIKSKQSFMERFSSTHPSYDPNCNLGHEYRGPCPKGHDSVSGKPFRGDETFGYCYSCGVSYDLISLVQEFECGGCRKSAVIKLAREFDITLPEDLFNSKDWEDSDEYQKVLDLFKFYATHCEKNLDSVLRNDVISKYGLKEKTLEFARVGFGDESFIKAALENGFSEETLVLSGLVKKTEYGLKPFFNKRIVVPYFCKGKIVYWIGRRCRYTSGNKYENAKYKKLPVFSKNNPQISKMINNDVLFNIDSLSRINRGYHE